MALLSPEFEWPAFATNVFSQSNYELCSISDGTRDSMGVQGFAVCAAEVDQQEPRAQ
jgi:hypothetical protein